MSFENPTKLKDVVNLSNVVYRSYFLLLPLFCKLNFIWKIIFQRRKKIIVQLVRILQQMKLIGWQFYGLKKFKDLTNT